MLQETLSISGLALTRLLASPGTFRRSSFFLPNPGPCPLCKKSCLIVLLWRSGVSGSPILYKKYDSDTGAVLFNTNSVDGGEDYGPLWLDGVSYIILDKFCICEVQFWPASLASMSVAALDLEGLLILIITKSETVDSGELLHFQVQAREVDSTLHSATTTESSTMTSTR